MGMCLLMQCSMVFQCIVYEILKIENTNTFPLKLSYALQNAYVRTLIANEETQWHGEDSSMLFGQSCLIITL